MLDLVSVFVLTPAKFMVVTPTSATVAWGVVVFSPRLQSNQRFTCFRKSSFWRHMEMPIQPVFPGRFHVTNIRNHIMFPGLVVRACAIPTLRKPTDPYLLPRPPSNSNTCYVTLCALNHLKSISISPDKTVGTRTQALTTIDQPLSAMV